MKEIVSSETSASFFENRISTKLKDMSIEFLTARRCCRQCGRVVESAVFTYADPVILVQLPVKSVTLTRSWLRNLTAFICAAI